MRVFLMMAVVVLAAAPGLALAQPPGPPTVEVGAQVSRKVDFGARTWTPRITFNVAPLTAIEAAADFQRSTGNEFGTRTEARGFNLHWRQTLFTSGRWQVFGVLGAGVNRVEQDFPEQIFQGRDGPEVIPAYTFVDTEPTVHLGPAIQFEAARWLALRGDLRLTIGDNNGGLRGMVGAVVPIGRFPASNLRQLENRDGLKNGILIGGATGGLAGAALFTWAASVFCETDDCETFEGAAAVLGAASGIAVGGLLGAMVDSLIPGKPAGLNRDGVRLTPVATRDRKSLGVEFRWR